MANKQIYELTTRTFDGDCLVPFDTENTDPSTQAEKPYLSSKTSGDSLADFIANEEEYTNDLTTEDKTLTGAINELLVYALNIADEYDSTSTYDEGDFCLYEGVLYKCLVDISVAEAWDSTHWTSTLIVDNFGTGGGASVTLGTTVPSDASGSNGDLYVQYDGTSYAVIDYYVKINGSWRKSPYSRVVALTQAQYDLITPDNQTLYVITDKQGSYVKLPVITDAWNSSTSYTVGSYCIHNDTLWKCTTANSNQEPASGSTYWDDTSVADELTLKANKSDIEYHVGDTINISNLQLTGLITSGQKSIYIQLPLPKPIGNDVNTITLNPNALFYIRHVSGGYIINNQTLTSIGTVTLKKNLSGIFIGVDMTNAFTGCPNNTPLVISTGEGANDSINFS